MSLGYLVEGESGLGNHDGHAFAIVFEKVTRLANPATSGFAELVHSLRQRNPRRIGTNVTVMPGNLDRVAGGDVASWKNEFHLSMFSPTGALHCLRLFVGHAAVR